MIDRRVADYIDQIRRAAEDACQFIAGMDKGSFLADKRTQQAVSMSLMIIGEAAARIADLSPDFVRGHPAVPWRSMRGMRNRIAHGYFELDFDVVWETVQVALPDLLKALPNSADSGYTKS